MTAPHVYVGPVARPLVADAVAAAGGVVVADAAEADVIVWTGADPADLRRMLRPDIRWVQLSGAGIERWVAAGVIDDRRVFTSAGPAYADSVAEHALALLLAAARGVHRSARSAAWERQVVRTVRGATVTIVGCGRIGSSLIRMLHPLGAAVEAVNRSGRPIAGAVRTWPVAELHVALAGADFVVVTAPATDGTRHLLDGAALRAMRPGAALVNVGRGSVIDTGALIEVLADGRLGAVALDVTDPEPLPDGHPLWSHPDVVITPHVANPPEWVEASLAGLVADNLRRYTASTPLVGIVNPGRGY